jgi:hypothetical protein
MRENSENKQSFLKTFSVNHKIAQKYLKIQFTCQQHAEQENVVQNVVENVESNENQQRPENEKH